MELQLEDIQGLWKNGHGNLPSAQFLLFRFSHIGKTRAYLKALQGQITHAAVKPEMHALQIGFTYKGLAFLDLPQVVLESFSREFKEGMTEINRQFILGDQGENAPENWGWGMDDIHMLLMVYAKNTGTLDEVLEKQISQAELQGLVLLHSLPTGMLQGQKEHFGFRDDISRPIIRELIKNKIPDDKPSFPAGEFIMGYKNLYDEFAPSPLVPIDDDPHHYLPSHPDFDHFRDLGKNGTYLIFRQMEQRVFVFWEYLKKVANDEQEAISLASKMVGRWPDGSPLTLCPVDSNSQLSDENNFGFWNEDRDGLKCPIGAHIRRTNPRDHLVTERTQKDSSEMAAKHRMIRKGRPYGPPVAEQMDPLEIMSQAEDHKERGLHFICLVTDIRRQFEFVQNNWVNFHKFGGLEQDADPIIGHHQKKETGNTDEFSIPQYPVRRKLRDLPNFTLIKGGGYFFFPGLKAIQYIAAYE